MSYAQIGLDELSELKKIIRRTSRMHGDKLSFHSVFAGKPEWNQALWFPSRGYCQTSGTLHLARLNKNITKVNKMLFNVKLLVYSWIYYLAEEAAAKMRFL